MKKRLTKSRVVLDQIDLQLLDYLLRRGRNPISSEAIRKYLDLTHKAFLIHIHRLEQYGYLRILQLNDNKKNKYYCINDLGKNLLIEMNKSDAINRLFEEYFINYKNYNP